MTTVIYIYISYVRASFIYKSFCPIYELLSYIRASLLYNISTINNINAIFKATRYHSLVSSDSIPDCLEITAVSVKNNEIMGIKHKEYPVFGLQFHPESIETKYGIKMIENFINVIQ